MPKFKTIEEAEAAYESLCGENKARRLEAEAAVGELKKLHDDHAAAVSKLTAAEKLAGEQAGALREARLTGCVLRAGFKPDLADLVARMAPADLQPEGQQAFFADLAKKAPGLLHVPPSSGPNDTPGSRGGTAAGPGWTSGQVLTEQQLNSGFKQAVKAAPSAPPPTGWPKKKE